MPGDEQVLGVAAAKAEGPEDDAQTCVPVDSYVRRRNLFKKLWVSPLLFRAKKATLTQTPKVIRTQRMEGASLALKQERSRELHKLCNKLLRVYHRNNKTDKQTHIYKRKRRNTLKKRTLKSKSLYDKKAKSKKADGNDLSDDDGIDEITPTAFPQIGPLLMIDKSTAYQDLDLLDMECGYQANQGKRKSKRKRCRRKKGKNRYLM